MCRRMMRRRISISILAGAAAVMLSACGAGESRPAEAGEGPSLSEDERAALELATATLSEHKSISRADIHFVQVSHMEWPDSSLGCPQPGVEYLQVITPGYRVLLTVETKPYSVHTGGGHTIVCERMATGAPKSAADGTVSGATVYEFRQRAQADLAEKLGASVEQVEFVRMAPRTWPDASLGCPEPGKVYAKAATQGYMITLKHRDRSFTYHTDFDSLFPCPRIEVE